MCNGTDADWLHGNNTSTYGRHAMQQQQQTQGICKGQHTKHADSREHKIKTVWLGCVFQASSFNLFIPPFSTCEISVSEHSPWHAVVET